MENPFETTEQANKEVAELIQARDWEKINYDLEALIDADGYMLVEHEGKRLSILDLAIALGAPQEVFKTLEEYGFQTTEITRRRVEVKAGLVGPGR